MLHAAFLRSDIARGTITRRSTSTPRASLPGVVAVFTGADLNGDVGESWVDFEGPGDGDRPFRALADGDVRFAGEPVALVVAESRYIAEDACELIELDIEPIDAGRRPRRRARPRRPPSSTPGSADNIAGSDPRRPTTPSSTRSSRRRRTSSPRRSRSTATCACRWRCRGVVSIWDAVPQRAHRVDLDAGRARRARLPRSRASACPRTASASIMGDVGGGFGQKMFMLPDEVAVVLGRQAPRPAR